MPGKAFDSNVLLPLPWDDPIRAATARAMIGSGGTISVQILNEIANVALRKKTHWRRIGAFLEELKDLFDIVPVDLRTHEEACRLAQRYKLAFYDAAVVASALLADCDTLWSEDMHDGLVIDGRLTIRNPFV